MMPPPARPTGAGVFAVPPPEEGNFPSQVSSRPQAIRIESSPFVTQETSASGFSTPVDSPSVGPSLLSSSYPLSVSPADSLSSAPSTLGAFRRPVDTWSTQMPPKPPPSPAASLNRKVHVIGNRPQTDGMSRQAMLEPEAEGIAGLVECGKDTSRVDEAAAILFPPPPSKPKTPNRRSLR